MVKIRENPIKMDDFGVPLFLETPSLHLKMMVSNRNLRNSRGRLFSENMLVSGRVVNVDLSMKIQSRDGSMGMNGIFTYMKFS